MGGKEKQKYGPKNLYWPIFIYEKNKYLDKLLLSLLIVTLSWSSEHHVPPCEQRLK